MCHTKLLFIFIFFSVSLCFSQENQKLDSLLTAYSNSKDDTLKVQTAHALHDFYRSKDPQKAFKFTKEGLTIAQRLGYAYGSSMSFYHIGTYYNTVRNPDSARLYINRALKGFASLGREHELGMVSNQLALVDVSLGNYTAAHERVDKDIESYTTPTTDTTVLLHLYLTKANILRRQSQYKEGIEYAIQADKFAELLQDEYLKQRTLGTLANLYHYMNDYEKSLEYKKQGLAIAKKNNYKRDIAVGLNNIGNTTFMLGRHAEALQYFEQSLPISEEIKLNNMIAITSFNIGKTHVELGAVEEGITHLKKSLSISQDLTKSPHQEIWALSGLGRAYNRLNQAEKSLPYLNLAVRIADSLGVMDDLFTAYRDRSRSHELLGDYRGSLEDFKEFQAVKDSVYNIEQVKEIERLTAEFETEKKEQQIAQQETEISLLEEKEKVSSLQKWLLGSALGLSVLAFCFGFYGIRQRLKRNRLEKEKVEADLEFKKKELTTHALHLAKKNEVLEELKQKAKEFKAMSNDPGYKQLVQTIDFDLQDENNWENFGLYFEQVHHNFNATVKKRCPNVTSNELRLMALLKMNLSTKEMANMLNITQEGVRKAFYRLRKKMDLPSDESLRDLVIGL